MTWHRSGRAYSTSSAAATTIAMHDLHRAVLAPDSLQVVLTEPQFLSTKDRDRIAEVMFETLCVLPAVQLTALTQCRRAGTVHEAPINPIHVLVRRDHRHRRPVHRTDARMTDICAVDIGDRLDVVPIDQGFEIDKGVSKIRYGGGQVTDALGRAMSGLGHRCDGCSTDTQC